MLKHLQILCIFNIMLNYNNSILHIRRFNSMFDSEIIKSNIIEPQEIIKLNIIEPQEIIKSNIIDPNKNAPKQILFHEIQDKDEDDVVKISAIIYDNNQPIKYVVTYKDNIIIIDALSENNDIFIKDVKPFEYKLMIDNIIYEGYDIRIKNDESNQYDIPKYKKMSNIKHKKIINIINIIKIIIGIYFIRLSIRNYNKQTLYIPLKISKKQIKLQNKIKKIKKI